MTNLDKFIVDLALIMVASAVFALLFRRLKLPLVLGYIIAGFLISPNFTWLPTVVETQSIQTWADIGIVFLMFALGLEFSFRKLSQVGTGAFVTALTVMGGMTGVGVLLGHVLGFERTDCLYLGCMLSMSSTMIILKSFEERKEKDKKHAGIVLGALVVEDVGGIFMMILLSTVSLSHHVSGWTLAGEIGMLLVILVVWLSLGIYLIPSFLKNTAQFMNDEVRLIVSLAICFGMVVISHMVGFSEALGAFLAGSILAGTVSGEAVEKLVKPLKDLFGAVFFVSVGMMVVPAAVAKYWLPILIISLVVILGQKTLSTLGILLSGQDLETAVYGGSAMVQIGEFSFIIGNLGVSLGVMDPSLMAIIVSVSILTIFLTPVSLRYAPAEYRVLSKYLPPKLLEFIAKYTGGRHSPGEESLWLRYFRRWFLRTGITTSVLAIVYYIGVYRIMPTVDGRVGSPYGALVGLVFMAMFMTPVMNLMLNFHSNSFRRLWMESLSNRLPLMLLRTIRLLLAGVFIVLGLYRLFNLSFWVTIPVALVIVAIIIKSDFMRSQALSMDSRFRANLNEKLLAKNKQEREVDWILDRIFVVEFGLDEQQRARNIASFLNERFSDVLIMRIHRSDDTMINMPLPDDYILPGDRLLAISGREQLLGYISVLIRADHIIEPERPMITLRTFLYDQGEDEMEEEDEILCVSVHVPSGNELAGKTIRNSGFRERYNGFIIGMERGNMIVADPSPDVLIRARDTMWVVGTREMIHRLRKDKLI